MIPCIIIIQSGKRNRFYFWFFFIFPSFFSSTFCFFLSLSLCLSFVSFDLNYSIWFTFHSSFFCMCHFTIVMRHMNINFAICDIEEREREERNICKRTHDLASLVSGQPLQRIRTHNGNAHAARDTFTIIAMKIQHCLALTLYLKRLQLLILLLLLYSIITYTFAIRILFWTDQKQTNKPVARKAARETSILMDACE